jgi:hypothetical protein
LRLPALLTVLAGLLSLGGTAVAHTPSLKVVASGLDNPRGLDVSRWGGSIYVAEAGRGGDGPCAPSPEGGEVCVGSTGAVTKIWRGGQRRVVTGLPSLAGADGTATGPHDVALKGWGGLHVIVGLGGNLEARAAFGPLGAGLGHLYSVSPWGRARSVADLVAFEAAEDPDGEGVDSNPYSVVSRWGKPVVADAGGNDLVSVRRRGLSALAVFPSRLVPAPPGIPDLPPELPMQSVPTSVVVGPDGALYVGELTGFPFPVGGARIYRVEPGEAPEVYAEGFTNVIDIAFDRRGNLYVLEIATNGLLSGDPTGALYRVSRKGGERKLVISEGLEAPGGLAISRSGDIFISNRSTSVGTGEVVRLTDGRHHGRGRG